jgi:hypothetical protein
MLQIACWGILINNKESRAWHLVMRLCFRMTRQE